MSADSFPGVRFDGRTAAEQPILVHVEDAHLIVEAAEGTVLDRFPVARVRLSEPCAHAPVLIDLPTGASVEVPDEGSGFASALRDAGWRVPAAVRLQRRWPASLAALAALVTLLVVLYVRGVPVAARWVAFALPTSLEERVGNQLLAVLDQHQLQPSRLPGATRASLADRFGRVATMAAPGVTYRLEFRDGGRTGVNALALPGGTIVLLDGLVEFAANDNAVLSVLDHELGHVVHKHATRQLLQSLGVGTLASLVWGDFSHVAASVPGVLGVLRYSREFEREADAFALTALRSQGRSARPFHEFLMKVQGQRARRGFGDAPEIMSSHPSTEERLERLQRMVAAAGPGESGAVTSASAVEGSISLPQPAWKSYLPVPEPGQLWVYVVTPPSLPALAATSYKLTVRYIGRGPGGLHHFATSAVPEGATGPTAHGLRDGPDGWYLDVVALGTRDLRIDPRVPLLGVPLLRAPVSVGARWSYARPYRGADIRSDAEIVASETVTVPAGRFETLKVMYRTPGARDLVVETRWFARGIGLVRHDTATAQGTSVILLEHHPFPPGTAQPAGRP